MKEFKIGDKVTCLRRGKGEVVVFEPATKYSICVEFENGSYNWYIEDGKEHPDNINPMLYHGDVTVKIVEQIKKYRVVYKNGHGEMKLSALYYADQEEFEDLNCSNCKFISLIVDEDDYTIEERLV